MPDSRVACMEETHTPSSGAKRVSSGLNLLRTSHTESCIPKLKSSGLSGSPCSPPSGPLHHLPTQKWWFGRRWTSRSAAILGDWGHGELTARRDRTPRRQQRGLRTRGLHLSSPSWRAPRSQFPPELRARTGRGRNCFQATSLPEGCPSRDPSHSGRASSVAAMNALVMGSAASALAKSSATWNKITTISASSKHTFNISQVHPARHFANKNESTSPLDWGDSPTPREGSPTPVLEDVALATLPMCPEFWVPMLRQSTLDGLWTPIHASPGCMLLDFAFNVPHPDCVFLAEDGFVVWRSVMSSNQSPLANLLALFFSLSADVAPSVCEAKSMERDRRLSKLALHQMRPPSTWHRIFPAM